MITDNEEDCLDKCKALMSFLPTNNEEKAPVVDTRDDPERTVEELMDIVPPEKLFDMREVIKRVVDNGLYFELGEETTPKINVIVKKLFGGACLVMPVNYTKTDRYVAWPIVERGTMGAPGLRRSRVNKDYLFRKDEKGKDRGREREDIQGRRRY